jgi:hypothetical protein
MAPSQVKLKRTVIGINNSFSLIQLRRTLTQLGVEKTKLKEAEIPLVPTKTKSNFIKLINEITTTGKVAFYFFVYRKRLNFVCEKAKETEKIEYSGFRAYQNAVKVAEIVVIKQYEEAVEERGLENQKLQQKFQSAININECYDMDKVEEVYGNIGAEAPKEEKLEQKELKENEQIQEEIKFVYTPHKMEKDNVQEENRNTPLRNLHTNFDEETIIIPSNQTFDERLNDSIGPERVTNKRFNNQSVKKIKLDEYNFDTDDNRNPNDWLANAIFCLTLEDRASKMDDGEKISSLMRALKGNLKETMFAKLRETPANELTLQMFQELFRKHTTKSIREIENRLAKVSKSKAGSYQDLYMQINNLIVEQMMVSGITKDLLNKEVIQAMTERLFKKKCHPNSETFQTTTKKGQELIDLADELNELIESKSLNAMSKILPEKPNTEATASYSNEETRKCYRCGKPGHFIADCRSPDKRLTKETSENTQQSYRRNWGKNQQQGWQNNPQQTAWRGNNQQQGWPNNQQRNPWQGGRGEMNGYQPNRTQNNYSNRYVPQLGSSNFRGNYHRGGARDNNWVNNRSNDSYNRSQNFGHRQADNRRGSYRSGRGDWGNHRY